MAKLQTLSDVLQAIGYSELIDSFNGENIESVQELLTDAEIVKKIVPDNQLEDFSTKVTEFFENEKNCEDDSSSSCDEDNNSNFELARIRNVKENLDTNNIRPLRHQPNVNKPYYDIENVDIHEILNKSFGGKQILSWHLTNSYLKPGQRKRLVHHVMAGVMNVCERPLHPHDFKVLTRKILKVFPKECALVYYEPRVPKNKSNTGRPKKHKGKLLNKYKTLKKVLLQLNAVKVVSEPVEPDYENPLTEELEQSIEWLKNQEEPWDETERHWKITAEYRHNQIQYEFANKISSTYEEWPILKTPNGYMLIDQDFTFMKFTSERNAIDNFKDFINKALLAKPLRKDEHTDLLQGMLVKTDLKEDNDVLIRLMLICIALPSTARIPVGKGKIWKPSAVESLEGIVTRVKIFGDIERAKLERHQLARSRNLTVQPYLIVVEEDDYDVESTYLCIDNITYLMPSLLDGLDMCFKSFHVLKANYTAQSQQVWILLQLGLYKFQTSWDTSEAYEILNDMRIDLPAFEN